MDRFILKIIAIINYVNFTIKINFINQVAQMKEFDAKFYTKSHLYFSCLL